MSDLTVVIPTIARCTLQRSIESLQNQTVQDWNAILVYDGVEPTLHFDDRRFTILRTEKLGSPSSAGLVRNVGIQRATTDWVGFLDDDDVLTEIYVEVFLKYKNFCDAMVMTMAMPAGGFIPHNYEMGIAEGNVGISFCYNKKKFPVMFEKSRVEDFRFLSSLQRAGARIMLLKEVGYKALGAR